MQLLDGGDVPAHVTNVAHRERVTGVRAHPQELALLVNDHGVGVDAWSRDDVHAGTR